VPTIHNRAGHLVRHHEACVFLFRGEIATATGLKLTKDEARRIAAKTAKMPELLSKP
jgi:hypothetical protein